MAKPNLPTEWIEHDQKLKPYLWSHRIPSWLSSLLSLGLLIYFLMSPAWSQWAQYVENTTSYPFLQWLLFLGGLIVFWKIVSLPFSFAHYQIERHFKLSKQSLGSWVGDLIKGSLLGAVIGTMALGLIYWSVRISPEHWWIVCAFLLICFSILLAQLAPVLLIPIFFKMKPMEPGPLKDRLFKLCGEFKVEVKDVYHLGMGEKTEKGNAAFVGLGKTKRIIIGDTLYEKFSAEQVEAVFAHELGHQVHNDLWKGIGVSTVFMFVGFGISHYLAQNYLLSRYSTAFELPMGIFLFFITTSVVQMPMGILQSMYSRAREWAADKFASQRKEFPPHLASALEKLTYQNFGQFYPNPIWEFLTYSHPAPWRRITALRNAATV